MLAPTKHALHRLRPRSQIYTRSSWKQGAHRFLCTHSYRISIELGRTGVWIVWVPNSVQLRTCHELGEIEKLTRWGPPQWLSLARGWEWVRCGNQRVCSASSVEGAACGEGFTASSLRRVAAFVQVKMRPWNSGSTKGILCWDLLKCSSGDMQFGSLFGADSAAATDRVKGLGLRVCSPYSCCLSTWSRWHPLTGLLSTNQTRDAESGIVESRNSCNSRGHIFCWSMIHLFQSTLNDTSFIFKPLAAARPLQRCFHSKEGVP